MFESFGSELKNRPAPTITLFTPISEQFDYSSILFDGFEY